MDDDREGRLLMKTALEERGATVSVARAAADGLRRISQAAVLLADIAMPGEDGYSLMRKVRALPPARGGSVLAIAISAHATDRDRTRAMEAGFDRYLSKPVEPEKVFEVIADLLRARASAPVGGTGRQSSRD